MALSVRLDPLLESRVEQEARRRGITKSEVVKDALERMLGMKSPSAVYRQIIERQPYAVNEPQTEYSENSGEKFKALLRAKHSD
ncbi:CopG family transcriptional regulator [Sulfuricystis thermophila]|jgi:Arc/MetJ-type ribon-helix-helix transcriptional regulator|uniref:ribbon-helix-helix domain-containing protein n=1 Tax=Sulfuricystis thermophila TaxID=2496847 RepID=UPI001036D5C9|nr:CopG family transcriptional regulator [Sulfuricystis thermophila]